ncbi:TrlF family AAA-like ATPase [Agrobacterium rubi]|uniref:AAA family ATPase n=2 Tax=Agrobacterium rubi TaxID=28099 RepID=A0AAE7R9R0_9HYPH|nr:AAA family ATPase [Agrobacterium rubi]NTE90099.1 AAA family ATPase [Agrobacterium rubi]NTF39433.1 AAA family ATPase [Agrobacterium rubi]OCJ51780.1 phosphotransferase [Agrobacterium rubi]QTG03901.1 AAA family ATPase [Agrobacterium rubi]
MLERGSQWLRWEPHIHAPGTIFNDQFGKDSLDAYLTALEEVTPTLSAIGITDYYGIDTYDKVRAKKQEGRLPGCHLLFPNIEMRLAIGTVRGNFVNIHLLIDPSDSDHVEQISNLLGRLTFRVDDQDYGCTAAQLIRLGRHLNPLLDDDRAALAHGSQQYKVSLDDLQKALNNTWAKNNVLVAVAAGADGISGIKDAADATLRRGIERFARIIFSGSPNDRDFWLGLKEGFDSDFVRTQFGALKPTLWGCDAHDMAKIGKPDLDRFCWIKGDASFDALRQACIEPRRSYVGVSPTAGATPSQVISRIEIKGAPWALTPDIGLNSGLVAIIGARGSGKTALADMIAAGCDAFPDTYNGQSFLSRANADGYLAGTTVALTWENGGDPEVRPLDQLGHNAWDGSARARYLSQQFVDELCSSSGMTDALLGEIERVIFEAHPTHERDGTVSFAGLLDLKASRFRNAREREESALEVLSERIGVEMEKTKLVAVLKSQVEEKKKLIERYAADRAKLIPKGSDKEAARLSALTAAAEKARSNIRYFANQQASLTSIRDEVSDLRTNQAPEGLRSLKERHKAAHLNDDQWKSFLLNYDGDVDTVLADRQLAAEKSMASWKGSVPMLGPVEVPYVAETANLDQTALAPLEAEIKRLEKLIAADRETANKLGAISKRIAEETQLLQTLAERLADCEGARTRATELTMEREQGYQRVFDAILGEETVLKTLYAPLMAKLAKVGGTVQKLTFSVDRAADIGAWARRGEELLDGRKPPFMGQGTLQTAATPYFVDAWEKGGSTEVSAAMSAFRTKYQDDLLAASKVPKGDQSYRVWSRNFAQWLFSTDHISLRYSIDYDGIDITKLSPGTRGIVLLLLYLALDDADDRPLIIDQPEENLDPKSIFDELVGLFQAAKSNRQVIIVTHNANLVVNADADQIIIANVGPHPSGALPPITYVSGGLHEAKIRESVCNILEGGERAFLERARRLRVTLDG